MSQMSWFQAYSGRVWKHLKNKSLYVIWSDEDSTSSFDSNEEHLSNHIAFTFKVDIAAAAESDTDEASKADQSSESKRV